MSSVDDLFTTVDLDTGRATIYERMNAGRAALVKESMDQARRALTQFAFAEELLVRIATHLHDGLEQVDV